MGDWTWQIVEWPSSLWRIREAFEEDSYETEETVTITDRRNRRKRVTVPKTITRYRATIEITEGEMDALTDFRRKTTPFKAIKSPRPRGFTRYLRFTTEGPGYQPHSTSEDLPTRYTLYLTLIDITEFVEGGLAPTWIFKNSGA